MTNARLLSELAHVKALFHARTIAAVIGAPAPVSLKPVPDLWPADVQAEIAEINAEPALLADKGDL